MLGHISGYLKSKRIKTDEMPRSVNRTMTL